MNVHGALVAFWQLLRCEYVPREGSLAATFLLTASNGTATAATQLQQPSAAGSALVAEEAAIFQGTQAQAIATSAGSIVATPSGGAAVQNTNGSTTPVTPALTAGSPASIAAANAGAAASHNPQVSGAVYAGSPASIAVRIAAANVGAAASRNPQVSGAEY